MTDVKRALAVDAKLVWDYETTLVPASDYDALAADKADDVRRMADDANRIFALEARVQALEAALCEIANVIDCRGEVCRHIARDALRATSETDCVHPDGLVNGYCWICVQQVVPYSPAEPQGEP